MSTKKKEATRVRLLAAARELFEARGYHDIGLEEIAFADELDHVAFYLADVLCTRS